MELNELIKKIVPYYNKYKKTQKYLKGPDALEIIWEVGDLLKNYLSTKETAPRTLYEQIYGKSEGKKNIVQKSYITRDFLDRAFRVRRIFKNKNDIKSMLPNLQRYRLFYKSMPFFDEGRFKLNGNELSDLIILLNSKKSYKEIMDKISILRIEKIKLRIPKDSKLKEMQGEKIFFIIFYNKLYKAFSNKNYSQAIEGLECNFKEFVEELSKNTGALSSDQLKISQLNIPSSLTGIWLDYSNIVNKLASKKEAIERRRFRRLIAPEKMMRLSEMIYALRSEDDFNKFRL